MKNTGILRIQAFAARQSSPVEGVTVTVSGNGFTATRLTDAEGNADDITLTTPACALSLDENNTTQPPYAVCDLVASKTGYRTVRIQGVQVFPGQVTLAQPEMIPDTEEMRDTPNVPIVIPPHSLFTGDGGSGPNPFLACVPRVIAVALLFRTVGVLLCLAKTTLNWKERLFCVIAYLPKATVQAAIGSVPMAMGLPCGQIILSVAVMAILITAPLGALGMDASFEKLLEKRGEWG